MDSFKVGEMARMDKGGNKAWRSFFEGHESTKLRGLRWADCTIGDRYGGEVGDEWKGRLTALAEGKEYVPQEKQQDTPDGLATKEARNGGDASSRHGDSRSGTPLGRSNTADSSTSSSLGLKKTQNEAYFARLGKQNSSRSTDAPPNQGGKYTGFGSGPPPPEPSNPPSIPGIDEFQKDPMAALTKGFGWFSTAVGKSAKSVNDGWIQPAAQKVRDSPNSPGQRSLRTFPFISLFTFKQVSTYIHRTYKIHLIHSFFFTLLFGSSHQRFSGKEKRRLSICP